jgi:SAM-dependent methyltransferase
LHYPDSYYYGRDPSVPVQYARYRKQLAILPKKTGKLLDVGCATGAWLLIAQNAGWECYGTDFVSVQGQIPKIDIRIGAFPSINYESDFFDVVTAWGVMEHIYAPSQYFSAVRRVLKNGGRFIFLVPNANSLWSRWAYKEDIPRHVQFFTKKSIVNYSRKYGFDIAHINITNNIYSRPATGRGMFKRNILRLLGCSWSDIVEDKITGIHKIYGSVGSVLDTLVSHKVEEYFGLSGNMIVELVKR